MVVAARTIGNSKGSGLGIHSLARSDATLRAFISRIKFGGILY